MSIALNSKKMSLFENNNTIIGALTDKIYIYQLFVE
jgi:hypothetical protein